MLGRPRGLIPHRRFRVHPPLRLLPDRHRQAGGAGPLRAVQGRHEREEDGPALRHRDWSRPRRSPNVFAAETGSTPLVEFQSKSEVVDTESNEPIVPYEVIKDEYAKKHIKLKESDIPTIKEFNEIVETELNVSKDNPTQTIELGNGFTVEASVWEETNFAKSSSTIQPLAVPIYNKTAKGSFTVKSLGVNQFRITVSDNFDYNGTKITSYQDPPSASAEAWLGWSGSITNKDVRSIDATAKDGSPSS